MTDKRMIASVGDDASVCRSHHQLVQAAGYAVETFASAQESLEWLPDGQSRVPRPRRPHQRHERFELQEWPAVPVIFITSHDGAVTRTRIERSGSAGHLRKGFDAHAVLGAIRRAVGLDPQSSGTPSPNCACPTDQEVRYEIPLFLGQLIKAFRRLEQTLGGQERPEFRACRISAANAAE